MCMLSILDVGVMVCAMVDVVWMGCLPHKPFSYLHGKGVWPRLQNNLQRQEGKENGNFYSLMTIDVLGVLLNAGKACFSGVSRSRRLLLLCLNRYPCNQSRISIPQNHSSILLSTQVKPSVYHL